MEAEGEAAPAEEENKGEGEPVAPAGGEAGEAPAPAGVSEAGTPNIVSKAEAEPVEIGELVISNEQEEVVGATNWEELFGIMKAAAEAAGKEVSMRPSRRDPEDSQANKFYMAEQVFSQSVEEKHPSNSIDLHVIRVKEALQLTANRFKQIEEDLANPDWNGVKHNCGDGTNHLFKVICGQGTHSDENGPKMKYAMKQWLTQTNVDHTASLHHGIYFVNLGVKTAS